MCNEYGSILSKEHETIVRNVKFNAVSNSNYNHGAIIRIYQNYNKILEHDWLSAA